MKNWQGILAIFGVLAGLVVCCGIAIGIERKFPGKEYDERQNQARGRAYRLGFIFGTAYYLSVLFWMLFDQGWSAVAEPQTLIFVGLLVQVMVMHIYCILTDAALPMSEKPGVAVICYGFLGIGQLLTYDYGAAFSLIGSERLLSGIAFLSLAVMHGISLLRKHEE